MIFILSVLPPLAYSITRYSVLSVSMTSKSFTARGDRETDSENTLEIQKMLKISATVAGHTL